MAVQDFRNLLMTAHKAAFILPFAVCCNPYGAAGKTEAAGSSSLTTYKIHPAYELVLEEDLPDIQSRGIFVRHKKSGARVALLPCEDTNKVFYIAFRTPPKDSTGAAHIVEHTVLCGSEKYPLKDPFIGLLKGSLNTYLNATTYPEKTMYPVASTNDRDFRNLMDVYLDAVFHPNIYREQNIFRQEGWSFRMEDADAPLELSGVVYNEMKGAFSSPEDTLDRRINASLFPHTSYAYDSGGDPDEIPSLTYEEFLSFHAKYYHPSNSYIYLYGDIDTFEMLRYLDEEYLGHYDRKEIDSRVPEETPFLHPVTDRCAYPVAQEEAEEEKTYLSMNFVVGRSESIADEIAMDVLDYALFSMPGAPVRQAVLDAGIGDDFYGMYTDGIAQPYFSCTAKNAEQEEEERFRSIVLQTMKDIADAGIDREALLAGIGSLEFQFREADYATWPKGLIYGVDIMDDWLFNDNAVFSSLKQLAAFASLKKHVSDGDGYFERLLRKKLIENPYRADVILYPERGLQEKRDRMTEEMLQKKKASLTAEEIQKIVDETKALRAWQEAEETPEALASLPSLHISDLSKEALVVSNIEEEITVGADGPHVPFLRHETDAKGISYTHLLFRADAVPEEELIYLALLRSALINIDTKMHGYNELINLINSRTGGISCNITSFADESSNAGYCPYFVLRGRALYEETPFLYRCFEEILTASCFDDPKRIGEIIAELHAHQQMVLTLSGHSTATLRALSGISPESAFQEAVSGIRFYRALDDLYEHYEEKKEEICQHLSALYASLFTPDNLMISYTSENTGAAAGREAGKMLAEALQKAAAEQKEASILRPMALPKEPLPSRREGFITGGQVQNVAMAGSYRKEGLSFRGSLHVLRHILNYGYLWDRIRTDGNAYGCGISFTRSGYVSMSSYRDPHLQKTLDVFRELPAYVASFEAGEEEMEKYIIGTVSSLDTPLTASLFGAICLRAYMNGVTHEMMQLERDEVLRADAASIRALAPYLAAALSDNVYCVVGSETGIRRHEDLFDEVRTLL